MIIHGILAHFGTWDNLLHEMDNIQKFDNVKEMKVYKVCGDCGKKQSKEGLCWDFNKCTLCFNKESMGYIRRKYV